MPTRTRSARKDGKSMNQTEAGIALDLVRSGLSKREFALRVGVELSRLKYWLELARLRARGPWGASATLSDDRILRTITEDPGTEDRY